MAARGSSRSRHRRGGWRARSDAGRRSRADTVLVCTNAYCGPSRARAAALDRRRELAPDRDRAPFPTRLPATILPGGEVLSDTRQVIRYWRLDDAGRLDHGRPWALPRAGTRSATGRISSATSRRLFPLSPGFPSPIAGADASRSIRITWPRLHRPRPGLLVAIGCQGRGIGWQTRDGSRARAMLVDDPDTRACSPVSGVVPIPFAPLQARSGSRRRSPPIGRSTGSARMRRQA